MPGRSARAACLAGAAALALAMALRKTADFDCFVHLAVGRAALTLGWRLPVDPFSFGRTVPWRYKDLIAAVIFYAGFARWGYLWLALLKGLVALAIAAALWCCPPPEQRRPPSWLLLLGLLLAALAPRFAERPQLFSLAALPALLTLLERQRAALAAARPLDRVAAWLPLVALEWGWAQLHREAMVGLLLVTGFAAWLTLARLLPAGPWAQARPSGRSVAAAWLAAAAAWLASALNPNGTRLWSSSLGLGTTPIYRQMIAEWQALTPSQLVHDYPAATLLSLSGAVALGLRAARRRAPSVVDGWHLGCWLLFAWLTLGTLRWLPTLAIFSAVVDLLLLAELSAGWRPPRGATALAAVAALALVGAAHPQPLGLGERPGRFPGGALAFAAAHALHPRVVNAYPFGGYVAFYGWPRLRVLVDGRADTVYPIDFVVDITRAEHERAAFDAMRAADGADWVLTENKPGGESHLFLAADPAWSLVYWSEAALVWVRRDAYPELAPLELRWVPRLVHASAAAVVATLAPLRDRPDERAAVERELQRLIASSPDSFRANSLLALFYDTMGERARRDAIVRHLTTIAPDHPALDDARSP